VPSIAAVLDTPDPVQPGNTLLLNISGVSDDAAVSNVRTYRESNGIPGLQFATGGDSVVAMDTNGADGWTATVNTAGLPNGIYTYYAQPADNEGLVGEPASTTSTIGAPLPLAVDSSVLEFQTRQAVVITFNNPLVPGTVSAADLAALNLDNGATPVANSVILSAGNTVATWVFNTPGTYISNGDYRFTLPAASVSDINGNALVSPYQLSGTTIFFYGGDANRDRKIDVADLGILASNWLLPGFNFSQGNFDYSADGMVGVGDLGILASQWQQVLAGPDAATGAPARKAADSDRIAAQVL
jgi:hypothetical protein